MKISKRNKRKLIGLLLFASLFYWCFPKTLFDLPYSTIVNDENGELLAAKIAKDGQWRFPEVDSVPQKLKECILHFEDEYFYSHPGVNPISTFRAIRQNISAGSVVSGGSTISMQVMRLSRKNPSRSYWEKIKELYLAVRLEFSYSKDEILKMYVSHAPYGGNVVGAETAAWRYFNRPLHQLSWAEYATLAVLPNSPGLIRPGKNSIALKTKRDDLLKKLFLNQVINSSIYELAVLEPLPGKPHPLPNDAYHLLSLACAKGFEGKRLQVSINSGRQKKVTQRLNAYVKYLQNNEINNACALVFDLEEGKVVSYVGNANFDGANAKYVDLIQARRSSGSILKPFLYASAFEEGSIHPESLLEDVPISINGFSPNNFNKKFEGVVPAKEALARSLNVPATNLLKEYGVSPFYQDLVELGFTTIDRSPDNYGLSLILGGAEVNLWEVAMAYANQVQNLNTFFSDENKGLELWSGKLEAKPKLNFEASAWWMVTEALKEVQRPGLDLSWQNYSSSRKIAWKTGTSFGFRDAWAVGYDKKYLVAVWVGNAQGEGRPGLTGTSTAAPLMFDIFQDLPSSKWFEKPLANLKKVELCERSGMSPNPNCPKVKTEINVDAQMPQTCPYHIALQLNNTGFRVNNNCVNQNSVIDTTWFSLGPVLSYYYKQYHSSYKDVPSYDANCNARSNEDLAIIYPQNNTELIIPKNFDGKFEKVLLEATQRSKTNKLYWHLDNRFLGETQESHKLNVYLEPGKHKLKIMDENGSAQEVRFIAH